jgi:hypothetical protein
MIHYNVKKNTCIYRTHRWHMTWVGNVGKISERQEHLSVIGFYSPVLDLRLLLYCLFLNLFWHMVELLVRVISSSQGLYLHRTTQHRKTKTNIHALSGIRIRDPVYKRSRHAPQTTRPLDRHQERPSTTNSKLVYSWAGAVKKSIRQHKEQHCGPTSLITLYLDSFNTRTSYWTGCKR